MCLNATSRALNDSAQTLLRILRRLEMVSCTEQLYRRTSSPLSSVTVRALDLLEHEA